MIPANRVAGEILRMAVNLENDLVHLHMCYIMGFIGRRKDFLGD